MFQYDDFERSEASKQKYYMPINIGVVGPNHDRGKDVIFMGVTTVTSLVRWW
jgi:hypothetical protein